MAPHILSVLKTVFKPHLDEQIPRWFVWKGLNNNKKRMLFNVLYFKKNGIKITQPNKNVKFIMSGIEKAAMIIYTKMLICFNVF